MNRRTTIVTLSLLSVLAVAARVGLMVHFRSWRQPNAMEHKVIARSLVAGQGFTFADFRYYGPTSVQSPPMPFLLAGLFKLYGAVTVDPAGTIDLDPTRAERAYATVMVLNALAGGGLVWLTYAAARAVGATPGTGVLAAGLVAVWPTQVYAAASVQAISFITCALAGMVALYYRAVRTGLAGAWTAYAAVAAVAALTEPVFLPAVVLTGGLMLLARSLTRAERARNGLVLAGALALVIGPWAARNYQVHGKLIPIKSTTWVNVWKGNNDFATGTDRLRMTAAQEASIRKHIAAGGDADEIETNHQYDMLDISQRSALTNQPEARREELFKRYAMDWITTHKLGYLRLCGVRLAKTLTIDWDNPRSLLSKSYLVTRLAVLAMTLAGGVVAVRQRWSLLYPAVVAACALGTYTLTVTSARFAFPFEPLQLILGAGVATAAASWMAGRVEVSRRDRSRTPADLHAVAA